MAKKRYILVIEPSVFRTYDTFVKGPFWWVSAWLVAHYFVWRHPHASTNIVSADSLVLLGERALWDGRTEQSAPCPQGFYR